MRYAVCCLVAILFAHLSLLSCTNDGGNGGGTETPNYLVKYLYESEYTSGNISYWNEYNEKIDILNINSYAFSYEFLINDLSHTIGIEAYYKCTSPYCSSMNRPLHVSLIVDDILISSEFGSGGWAHASIGPEPLSNFLDLITPAPEPHITKVQDAFIVNFLSPSMIFRNDGFGYFTLSEQSTWMMANRDVAIGDLDDDGDLDAFVAASTEGCCDTNQIYLVDEFGFYFYKPQTISTFGAYNSYGVALGDLDGDADLDAFVANYAEPNKVYFNEGLGIFSDSGQSLGLDNSHDIALDDLDGDGDIDAFIVNYGEPNKIYLNDGNGNFSDSGQHLGNNDSTGIALGDLNGDTYIDGFVVNNAQANRIYLNDGSGVFTDSGQDLGLFESTSIDMGDVDDDGDLDAVVTNTNSQPNKLYFNNGVGFFTDSGQELGRGDSKCVVLGKINP